MFKKIFLGAAIGIMAVFSLAAQDDAKQSIDADQSYAFGVLMGLDMLQFNLEFNYDGFMRGFKDAMNKSSKTDEKAATEIVRKILDESTERLAKANLENGKKILAENGKRVGVKTTESGLQYEVITQGNGDKPDAESVVRVDYEGALTDGTVFDSSYKRGQPAEFGLNQVIPGWSESVRLMTVGSKYKVWIPSDLAYGPEGAGNGAIPPNSVLIFNIELLDIIE
ncbi:peptidyl-prolyl cis-trans isomerase [Spirochaetia bacterium]|nr:peptidyl-prolyl cis-trans isomerase [Spirochaetia bacterium]